MVVSRAAVSPIVTGHLILAEVGWISTTTGQG
jgi:hypothetical protein